jgi:hypothetical protein
MIGRVACAAVLAAAWWAATGCVNAKAPERISVNVGGAPEPVDPSRLPATPTLEDCRGELAKAYQNIQYLERENAKLREKSDNYKHERDECRKRLKKLEKD